MFRYTAGTISNDPVTTEHLLQTLTPLCPDVDEEVIRDFVSRMDSDYFEQFRTSDIARHIRLAGRLDLDHPCQVAVNEREDGSLDIVVVAYDYFSEFATICGLLSAFGLDIREGAIYTFAEASAAPGASPSVRRGLSLPPRRRPRGKAGLARKKIVDVFRVRPMRGVPFAAPQRRQFMEELDEMIDLLDQNRLQDARERVNRRLVETLGRSRGAFTGLLSPVQIRFDNDASPNDTVMDIRSTDTPAFLYAFANALAMRGLYIRKARFEHVGTELRDRFYVRGRHGHKIEDAIEQQELKLTAALIKQFTHFLTWAPDPAKAIDSFDHFLDRILEGARDGKALGFLKQKKTLAMLARLLGTSDFLWEDFLRRQYANLLPMLEDYQRLPLVRDRATIARDLQKRLARARTDEQRRRALNQYKDREMFRIDMKHLLDPATSLPDFSLALTELAEVVLGQTARLCQAMLSRAFGAPRLVSGKPCPFAVFGMGKFGGRELGYASDIEVLFVYGGPGRASGRRSLENSEYFERLVQEILQWIEAKQEGIFHLDVRLRPHGGKGLLANTLDELRTYYSPSGLSAPFERQALIKLRQVWGDAALGRRVEAHRDAFVYSGQPWDLAAALDLRRRQVKELVEPGRTNVKYSPGGLIDVEYAVQYLQLMHGHTEARLRTPNTLQALAALGQAVVLKPDEEHALRDAYLFLRKLIDALRIVRGNAKDLVLPPADSDSFIFLARRLGYTTERWEEGATRLAAEIAHHMARTQEFFATRFGSPQHASAR
ncbi:MAG: hypothetical protein HY581_02265 [Nitrospirae bacterium]|nr:hypothetical protein [Nitrospirota bacterium]